MDEPYPSQAELGGFGRVLFPAREYWPDYMSYVLVDGIARSGLWLEQGREEREYAAEFVGRYYYSQPPALLRHALLEPIDRVMYTPLSPRRVDFELVQELMMEHGLLERRMAFEEYVDIRFAEKAEHLTAWKYAPWLVDND
jgi:NitT/TauT family transport system substrate-binding protein